MLPVIDLMKGLVVHGRGGQRDSYQAIQSKLAADARPASIAQALHRQLGMRSAYVADLDAIAGAEPDWVSYEQIAEMLPELWIDAGISHVDRASKLAAWQSSRCRVHPICALETLSTAESLREMIDRIGPERLIVSLDLFQGQVRSPVEAWNQAEAAQVAGDLIQLGVRRMIVLDVARVGVNRGTGTRRLTRDIKRIDPEIQITSGGGIGTVEQLKQLADDGCDVVLLATALHDGRLGRDELHDVGQSLRD